MSQVKIKKIRDAVLEEQDRGERVRYPEHIKKSVIKFLESGMSLAEVSRQTGLNAPAISKWVRKSEGEFKKISVPQVEEVDVENATTIGIGIILPSGVRIECQSSGQLKEILELLK